jgi:hypothetical protein
VAGDSGLNRAVRKCFASKDIATNGGLKYKTFGARNDNGPQTNLPVIFVHLSRSIGSRSALVSLSFSL